MLPLAAVVACALSTSPAHAASAWRPWPAPVPAGGKYETPPGLPGDLSFWAPNRGLMTVGGNNAVPEGIYSWDGASWHQLAVVCGSAYTARIAWAGPDEFWTIARPSLPRTQSAGTALCHFKDGEVVGSYSTVVDADDPYQTMFAAACNGPSDCWFGGSFGQDGLGRRSGAFHLHWDGATLSTVYGPQGRAVSDLLHTPDGWLESTYLGPTPTDAAAAPALRDPEPVARLLHHIDGTTFSDDAFEPAQQTVPAELFALDGDGQTAWAGGGGALVDGQPQPRPPLLARRTTGSPSWQEVDLSGAGLPTDQSLVDVAAVPGTGGVWAALDTPSPFGDDAGQPRVVHVAADGTATFEALAGDQDPIKGGATRVACPASDDCWLATARGNLYRWLPNGVPSYPVDTDPAFQGTITQRPNEAAEQAVPDDPPQDDSLLGAPPIELDLADDAVGGASCPAVPSLITKVKSKVHGRKRLRLYITFHLARKAKVGMTAKRNGKVVARAKPRTLAKGDRRLILAVSRKRWPTKLSFVVTNQAAVKPCSGAADSNTVSTG
ncbi:MAG TPA: hypothetical protein VNT03_09280 [Baekduia sp.]|nr:hypothetical protein [Baekduia sp.]